VTVGFTIPKTVGSAVVRNRVRRQLRHLMASRLTELPTDARVVVRVLPPAAGATSSELAADLDSALASVCRPNAGGPNNSGRPNKTMAAHLTRTHADLPQ